MKLKHWKFVGMVDSIDTKNDTWVQRVVASTVYGSEELDISWHLSTIPLPEGAEEGTFVSVHRTKAGKWYAVNLSQRMPNITESEMKRVEVRAERYMKLFAFDSHQGPTIG